MIRHFGILGKPESLSCLRLCKHCQEYPPDLEENETLVHSHTEVTCLKCVGAEVSMCADRVAACVFNSDINQVARHIKYMKMWVEQLESLMYYSDAPGDSPTG